MFWIGIVGGIIIGAALTIIVLGLCQIASENEK